MRELPSGTVTLLFTDIEGSTRLLNELGVERYREVLGEHRRVLRELFERHDGYEVDYEGDAFFVAFRRAGDAVTSAREGQEALAGGPVRVRMGMHTGEPVLDPPKYVGHAVHLAARVMSAGHGGQVLLTRATHELADSADVRDLGDHRLKDFAEPVRLFQLGQENFPPLKTISNTNLPVPASSFLGREAELAEAEELLASTRLLTITGPGGTGKTRFSIELAAGQVEGFTNGVFWVPLASLRDPSLVLGTIDQVVGGRGALPEHIADKRMLLLVDNFEHVIDAAAELATLLLACPNVTVVVTSRELLRIAGEREYPLPPLVPDEGAALFCDRARIERAPSVDELCRRLDNLPLAIELAAARTTMLTPEQLLDRLGQRLDLLKGGRDVDARQETLRATIEWSYELLGPEEQALFARLSVFAGGCRLEAAEAVAEAGLETLQSLIDKSLVRRSGDRLWMLETIREYAGEKLLELGAAEEVRKRHLEWFARLAESLIHEARTGNRETCFERLAADYDNVRAALSEAVRTGDADMELGLVSELWEFWAAHGHLGDTRFLDAALARTAEPPLRGRLGRAYLGQMIGGTFAGYRADLEGIAAEAELVGDRYSHVQALLYGAVGMLTLGSAAEAESALEEVRARSAGAYPGLEGEATGWLLISALYGPLPADLGITRCREAYDRAGENRTIRAFAAVERAALEAMRGNFDDARRLLAAGRQIFRELDLNVFGANTAQEAYFVEMLAGDPQAAVADLTNACERLAEMGERGFLSTVAGYLAHAHYALGDLGAAGHFSELCADAAAEDDYISQALWRSIRAKLAARAADEGALRYAEEAVEIMRPSDDINSLAERLVDLGEVLGRLGRPDDAAAARREALELYEQKGNLVAAERTRALLVSN